MPDANYRPHADIYGIPPDVNFIGAHPTARLAWNWASLIASRTAVFETLGVCLMPLAMTVFGGCTAEVFVLNCNESKQADFRLFIFFSFLLGGHFILCASALPNLSKKIG